MSEVFEGERTSRVTPIAALSACRSEITGVDHIAIAVADLEEAVEWYTQALGFTLVERRETRGERTGMLSAQLDCNGVIVILVQGTEPESQVSRFISKFGPGVQHIAFAVSDLARAVRRVAEARGSLDTPLVEGTGIRQAFLRRDPGSGVRVELIERAGGTFNDRSVRDLFTAFEARDLF